MIKYINVRPETLKLQWKIIEKTLEDICKGNYFLNGTPINPEIKSKFDK
jgi:hypothetical protein